MNNQFTSSTRRAFLGKSSQGLGAVALGSMIANENSAEEKVERAIPKLHHPVKAKRVIWLYMAGGMTHLETFDPKPKLAAMHGKPMPDSVTKGQQIAQLQGAKLNCFAPQHPFVKSGKSGLEISSIFPKLASQCADDMCIIRSMHTDAINHDPAHTLMNTGSMISGRPSAGSWLWYGLGSEAQNLPGFVVMVSTGRFGQSQPIAARQWHSGFLPGKYQGIHLRGQGDPVLYVRNPQGVNNDQQRQLIDTVNQLNQLESQRGFDPEITTRINQYEQAFRLQMGVPELVDFSKEPQKVLDLYGTKGGDGTFASNCLMARRLAERGCRFIQLYHRDWDHHGSVKTHSEGTAKEVDQGVAALLTDLKNKDMLKDTLIVFGTEFGRTPMAQGTGRDHHLAGFSMWLAGGGIKGGISYGNTDEFGYFAVENKVHVNDLHATMLYLMGIDHRRLTVKYQGRDFRLTDIAGTVLHPILA
ncbi:MAG: DUF1501 domain-containing protein [Zavarzinella sp.]